MSKKTKNQETEMKESELPYALIDPNDNIQKRYKYCDWDEVCKENSLIKIDCDDFIGVPRWYLVYGQCRQYGFVHVNDLEKGGYVKSAVTSSYTRMLDEFDIWYFEWGKSLYLKSDAEQTLMKLLSEVQPAYTLKGTDYPYYFKVNGKTIESETSSWHKFLSKRWGYISDDSLELYTGEDKYEEMRKSEEKRWPFPFPPRGCLV